MYSLSPCDSQQAVLPTPQTQEVNPTVKRYLKKASKAENIIENVFSKPAKSRIGENIVVVDRETTDTLISFQIDFSESIIVTHFKGERKTVKIGTALEIIKRCSAEYTQILSKINQSTATPRLLGKRTIKVLSKTPAKVQSTPPVTESSESLPSYKIMGENIVFGERLSISGEAFKNCAHLCDQDFIDRIAPYLKSEGISTAARLGEVIHEIYLGRRILGLQHRLNTKTREDSAYKNEAENIRKLMKNPESEFYIQLLF